MSKDLKREVLGPTDTYVGLELRVGISRAQNGRVPRVCILRVVCILGLWILRWVDCTKGSNLTWNSFNLGTENNLLKQRQKARATMGSKRKKHGQGGGRRRRPSSVEGGGARGEGCSEDSRGGGSGSARTPTDKGKRGRTSYEEGDGPATVTRGWIKTELEDEQFMKVREDLCAAIMRVYKGGTYGHPQELQFGWDEAVVRRMESSIREQDAGRTGRCISDLEIKKGPSRPDVRQKGLITSRQKRTFLVSSPGSGHFCGSITG